MRINKKIFTFIIAISLAIPVIAQRTTLMEANKYFNKLAYYKAASFYQRVLQIDSTNIVALHKIAECYRKLNDNKNEEKYYSKVVMLNDVIPIEKYYYGIALMEDNKYTDAKKWIEAYKAQVPSDERSDNKLKGIDNLIYLLKDSNNYKISNFSVVNSKSSDLGPIYFNNGILFSSNKYFYDGLNNKHSWTGKDFYRLYYYDSLKKSKPVKFSNSVQTRFNDGPVSFDKKNKLLYVTRNDVENGKVIKASDGQIKLHIYYYKYDDAKDEWSGEIVFEYNNKDYNVAHPAVSPDGNILVFSSDMPGGYGGMDLYICKKEGDKWGKPVNLGPTINTKGDEVFPYLNSDSLLIFSSNGLEGMGGLDLYYTYLSNAKPGIINHFSYPVNSRFDDFGMVINDDYSNALFSSNRDGGKGDDDIYKLIINKKLKPEKQQYIILVMDSTNRKQLNSEITIKDNKSGVLTNLKENDGKYNVDLFADNTYTIFSKSDGYKPKSNISFTTNNNNPFEILLNPEAKKYFIAGTIYEKIGNLTAKLDSIFVTIKDTSNKIVYSTIVTDTSGKYQSGNLQPNTKYTVVTSKKGYFTNSEIIPDIPPSGTIKDAYVSKIVIGKEIKIENIYFDFDKYNIRPDAAVELDKIVKLLNDNPEIIIELGSHTDCRGTALYNEWLSSERAKSSADYIVSKGINKNRVTFKGYGLTKPVNTCKCEACTDEEHQMNRRTEFKVTGFVSGMGNVAVSSANYNNVSTNNNVVKVSATATNDISANYNVVKESTAINNISSNNNVVKESSTSVNADTTTQKKEVIINYAAVNKYYILEGSYPTIQKANAIVAELKYKGYKDAGVVNKNNYGYWRVCYKSFSSKDEALKDLNIIRQLDPSAGLFEMK